MIVCFQIDVRTQQIIGAWWEIDDEELDCAYVDEISTLALAGTVEMYAKPSSISWHAWWRQLSERTSFSVWWEIAQVDDESYGYELLYKTWTCHPRIAPLVDEPNAPLAEAPAVRTVVQRSTRRSAPAKGQCAGQASIRLPASTSGVGMQCGVCGRDKFDVSFTEGARTKMTCKACGHVTIHGVDYPGSGSNSSDWPRQHCRFCEAAYSDPNTPMVTQGSPNPLKHRCDQTDSWNAPNNTYGRNVDWLKQALATMTADEAEAWPRVAQLRSELLPDAPPPQ